MEFWMFMLVMNLLIPIMMILFGIHYSKHAPTNISTFVGYRTTMSMKNMDTWTFAHHYSGKIMRKYGLGLFFLTIIAMCFVIGKNTDTVAIVGLIIITILTVAMTVLILVPTERALKKTFDKDGNRLAGTGEPYTGLGEPDALLSANARKHSHLFVCLIVVIFVIVPVGFVAWAIVGASAPMVYTMSSTSLTIHGQFGVDGKTIDFSDITNLELKSMLPSDLSRNSGDNVGNVRKGSFRTGKTNLNIYVNDISQPTFIYMNTSENGLIIFSDETAIKTQKIYDEVQQKMPK